MSIYRLSGPTLLPDGQITPATVTINNKCIGSIALGYDPTADIVTDGCIAPGLIDLQLNGGWGEDFTTDPRTVADVAFKLPRTGVTAFLPTIVTSTFESYAQRLNEIGAIEPDPRAAAVLGVHLEGPYLNPRRKGAHDPALLRAIDPDEVARWADHPLVRIATLAPELPGALDAIARLRSQGIVVSAGHSDASYEQAEAGFAAGVGWGTHVFNAMSGMQHREPGLATALLNSNIPCGIIPDGVHTHPALLALALRAKGVAGLTLVSDAMAALGMPRGSYRLAEREVVVDATSARLPDGTLAGSILTLDQALRNMITFTGCTLADALRMATETPARVLGLTSKGRIAPGCDADIVVLNRDLIVAQTFVCGRLAYDSPH